MEQERLRAIVHGRVQGVGYRYQAERVAHSLGLNGYVRNRADRTVEVIAEGPRPLLEQFLKWLHQGPGVAYVTRVETCWVAANQEFDGFEVRF